MKEAREFISLKKRTIRYFKRFFIICSISLCLSGAIFLLVQNSIVASQTKPLFQVGERLTYDISFEKFNNSGYAEIYVVSNGKLEGKDAFELSAKLKTEGIVSAVFYSLNQTRTTFVSGETGLPLYIRNISNANSFPKDNIKNFLNSPTTNYDLLSLIYKVRDSGGAGSFSVQEGENIYNFDFAATGGEVVKTDLGEFETTVSTVQSSYLTDLGITNFRINFSNDERKIPIQIRLKSPKGAFIAKIASIQNLEPETTPEPTATTTPTTVPTRTPIPVVTPTPFIENVSLSKDLPFELGETLDFKVTKQGQDVGTVRLQAKERTEFDEEDTLFLTAKVTAVGQGIPVFVLNDGIESRVEPFTLAPFKLDLNFTNSLSIFNQSTLFDQSQGIAINRGNKKIEIPVGTHNILSLAYAVRSFNLRPSLDAKNPINDTRVSVLLGDTPYVFTLRPQTAQIINLKGQKVSAQLVTIRTGNQNIDSLDLRLWLSNDAKRLPLRFTAAGFQADLIEAKTVLP